MGEYSLKAYNDEMLFDLVKSHDDRRAFSELYVRYWKILIDAAYRRLKSEEAAEEVVQDIFLSLYLRRRNVTVTTSLEVYLKTALKYQVFKVYRSQQSQFDLVNRLTHEEQPHPDGPEELLENKILRQRIYETAGRMPEKCREVFLLSRFEQLSHKDIALRLNISVATVKKHITKAMAILRREFGDRYLELIAVYLFLFSK